MRNDLTNLSNSSRTFNLLEFRRSLPDEEKVTDRIGEIDSIDGNRNIRCPICRWQPQHLDRWTCWDCDYPEYFYEGCGTEWNTFETGGKCPTCFHQWAWTSCLSCWGWSKHEDWYERD
ncbi:MAG: hypothetical protein HOP17_16380 [Acidobacteria bacterium]|nr:hypothetical protein [Acidobacteriota bacterium]